MTKIRIDTEYVREIGRRLVSQGDRVSEIGRELQRAIGGLDTGSWDGHSRARAEPMLSRVRPESARVADRLDDLGQRLTRVAEAFEEADDRSAAGVDTIPWFLPEPLLGWRTNPTLRTGTLLAGGGGAATVALTMLPATGDKSEISFVDRLKGIPSTVANWLSPAIAGVAGWFGWSQGSAETIPTVPWEELREPKSVEPSGTSKFVPVPPPQPLPKVTTTVTVERLPDHLLTPVLKQTARSYECAPTAASMVLGYWNKIDSENETRTPQEIIQGLGKRFNPSSGINADNLVAGLKEMDMGYSTIEQDALLDKQALQTELESGPVIAQVHLNWGTSGYAHMVTVTGISEDGKTVYVNDPWTGKAVEKTWNEFEKSWTFTGAYSGASHLIVKIRP